MSHIVTITTEVRDPAAITAACRRLKLNDPENRTVMLYRNEVTGLAVELPGWRYPIVCQTATGRMEYDNFKGRWGQESELHRFLQIYAVEKAKIEARRQGHVAEEQQLPDGSILVRVAVAG